MAVWLYGHVGICGYVAMWLCGYEALWLFGYVAVWLCGSSFEAMWLRGYMAIWLCCDVSIMNSVRIPRSVDAYQCPVPYCSSQQVVYLNKFRPEVFES